MVSLGFFTRPLTAAFAAMVILTLPPSPSHSQNISLNASYGMASLDSGFPNDPKTVAITAGGSIWAGQSIGGSCTGWIANAPDFRVQYQAESLPLSFYVRSATDTTLVVKAPDGSWHCSDDWSGRDPAITFQRPMSGQYDIWVGTISNSMAQSTLFISEFSPFEY